MEDQCPRYASGSGQHDRITDQVAVALVRNFEFKLPLDWLLAIPVAKDEHGQ